MSAIKHDRYLVITKDEFGQLDEHIFQVPWTIWTQLRTMVGNDRQIEIAEDATEIDENVGTAFADWIILKHVKLAKALDADSLDSLDGAESVIWYALLCMWDDEDGVLMHELADFLRDDGLIIEHLNPRTC